MKKIITILSSVIFLTMVSAKAEIQYGVGILAGQLNADGTETEGTAADTSDQTKSFEEYFNNKIVKNSKAIYLVNRFISSPYFEPTYDDKINVSDFSVTTDLDTQDDWNVFSESNNHKVYFDN